MAPSNLRVLLVLTALFLVSGCDQSRLGVGFRPQRKSSNGTFLFRGDAFLSNGTLARPNEAHHLLVPRQYTCRPGEHLCPDPEYCCPTGEDCFSDGCCLSGTQPCGSASCYDPSTSICCGGVGNACYIGEDCLTTPSGVQACCDSGEKLCGEDYCYNPDEEICCSGGVGCPIGTSCCGYRCCYSFAYCGSDELCTAKTCTTTTVTSSSTSTRTVRNTVIRSITVYDEEEDEDEPEAPDFSCPTATVTNSSGATLEIGDDCKLTLHISFGPETSAGKMNPKRAESTPSPLQPAAAPLRPRQDAPCTDTFTESLFSTIYATTFVYTTTTVTMAPESLEGFSCFPVVVTNAVGDELAIDDECNLEFTPATPTPDDSSSSPASSAGSQSSFDFSVPQESSPPIPTGSQGPAFAPPPSSTPSSAVETKAASRVLIILLLVQWIMFHGL